jgi:hypothetical protein
MAAGLAKSTRKASPKKTASADDDWEPPASAVPKPPAKVPAKKAAAKAAKKVAPARKKK